MNMVGRMSRSNSATQHQRQLTDSLDAPATTNKWLQSAINSQDFAIHGVQSSRMSRNLETSTSAVFSRSSSLRKNRDDHMSPTELSPGLLDLHSFDTELLPEMPISGQLDGCSFNQPLRGKTSGDSDLYSFNDKFKNSFQGLPENQFAKSFSADKERANNVAKIKVVVRKRPLNKKEISKKERDIITIDSNSLTVHETKLKVDLTEYVERHEFFFDAVLNENVSNDEVYFETVEPIVPLIFQRTKATCFAYGQTGSGKTYTMQPLPLKASWDILRLMHHTYWNQGYNLSVSFFEIYGGKLFDLLNDRKKLCMREDGKQQVCIVGLQEYKVSDVETIKELIEKGNAARSTGTTGANEESSRSHAILQLAIKRSADGNESKPARLVGKLSFIDLAGSERGADTTDNDKQTRIEGAEINKSLLALKECIRALDNDQNHIPFRGSKLTEVLRDSFVGDSRTVMISCVSPSSGSSEHTLNTLRYADRVKSLSKGNSSKRDIPTSSNLRDSAALPLSSSSSQTEPSFEDSVNNILNEKNRPGWSKQTEKQTSAPSNVDRVLSGRAESNLVASTYSDFYGGHLGTERDMALDDVNISDEIYKQEIPSWINNKQRNNKASTLEGKRKTDTEIKRREQINNIDSDDDLNALLKEEEDLVNAHRKQVEETIDIVREEMNLLAEADQPGNQLDGYVSKLNDILSQKAAGILQLQTRLAQFQKRLNDHGVLLSSVN